MGWAGWASSGGAGFFTRWHVAQDEESLDAVDDADGADHRVGACDGRGGELERLTGERLEGEGGGGGGGGEVEAGGEDVEEKGRRRLPRKKGVGKRRGAPLSFFHE